MDKEVPACIPACPTGALMYCELEEFEAICNEMAL
jgi:Fe-S-cluster-containing dehydrogenase component